MHKEYNKYIKDINDSVVQEKLEERQSTGINNDDSKPSSKCGPTAQFYRACAVPPPPKKKGYWRHFTAAHTSLLLAIAFHGSSAGTTAIHGKLPHNDGLMQPE